jgi:DNA polymerase-3 subunit beta
VKFRCERDSLVDALSTAGRAVSGRGGMLPVLSGVRAELLGDTLTLTGSDLDLTITVGLGVNGDADGATVLPAKLAGDVVRALPPGAVTVEVGGGDDDGGEARITADRAEFSLRVTAAEEYPKLPATDAEPVQLDAAELAGALRQVTPAASTDDNRPIITGVLLAAEDDGLRLVATDSYRLAVRDLAGQSGTLGGRPSVLVPSRALREVERLLGAGAGGEKAEAVTLRLGERDAAFEIGTTRVTTRLIEGEFPNYRGLIPSSYPNRLVVGRDPLLEAVRRVRLLARDATPVRLVLSGDALELLAITQDVGQAHEVLDAKYEGTDLTVAFNPDYLAQGIEATTGDEVVLETIDALKPAVIRSTESQDFLYLLMPVRVS